MNNKNGITTTRAIISTILLLALIAGIVFVGNYYDPKNRVTGTDMVLTEKDDKRIYDLPEDTTEYNFRLNCGNVTFEPTSETPYISIHSSSNVSMTSTHSNDKYDIRLTDNHNFFENLGNWIQGEPFGPHITVYLPNYQLKKLKVTVSAGNVDIQNINTDYLEIDVQAGFISVSGCDAINVNTEVSAGRFNYYVTEATKSIDAEVSAGNMTIYLPDDVTGLLIDYSISAGSIRNVSDFDFDGLHNGFKNNATATYGDKSLKMDLDVSAGSIKIDDYF